MNARLKQTYRTLRSLAPLVVMVALLATIGCGKEATVTGVDSNGVASGIKGKVIDINTGVPLRGVVISTTPATQSVLTDSLGGYSISPIDPGTYRITAAKGGYKSGSVDVAVPTNRVTTADIGLVPNGGGGGGGGSDICLPASPKPADGSVVPAGKVMLSWECAPGTSDSAVMYEVRLGTAQPLMLVGLTDGRSITVEAPQPGKTYFWQLMAFDEAGRSIAGPIWSFTTDSANTPGLYPIRPVPNDGASVSLSSVDLRWTLSDPNAMNVTYDIYFGTTPLPTLVKTYASSPYYHVDGLQPGTIYYWRVLVRDALGRTTLGPVWKFRVEGVTSKGSAIEFDGVDGHLIVEDAGDLDLSGGSFTLEGWIKAQPNGYFQWMFDKSTDNSNTDYLLGIDKTNRFTFQTRSMSTVLYGNTVVQPGKVYHLAAVVDSDTRRVFLLVNGHLEATGVLAGAPVLNSLPLRIGRRDIHNEFLNGVLDELRIWNVARTADDIRATMNQRLLDPLEETGLVAYWPMEEGSGNETMDATGNGHTARLVGGTKWIPSPFPVQ